MSRRFKLVCIGNGAIGKTCLLNVFVKDEFPEVYVPTVLQEDVADISVDEVEYELNIFDTAGQEDLDRLRPTVYPGTHVALICFSIDRPESFDAIETKWVKEFRHYCPGINYILVGLKSDLRKSNNSETSDEDLVKIEKSEELAKSIKAYAYVECSAKTKENVHLVFEKAVHAALANPKTRQKGCNLV
ncbi:ras-like gtp-binding protein rho [Anaeramoeba ignava]|uniref:Ras-like gtp-binding protein rho n=1 Tax=Anaeramoeba ignava TaxID=1746090 RepID=A0A9Q0LKH2_ANAIG|nr:ras-like gtp-binding protein rho [Anaeramoeba ignava]|eukprot:Anaeramoba_ignava/a608818_36.p1 GENE.a608818_36~~a608818_36.p1  ORF type:complete len:188 (-),score=47.91 a608818_36:56-619(-)